MTTITRTIPIQLQTSNRKTKICNQIIDKYNEMRTISSNIAPSITNSHRPRETILYQIVSDALDREIELPNNSTKEVKTALITEANAEVEDAYTSYWNQNSQTKQKPKFKKEAKYASLRGDCYEIVQSDSGEYAVDLSAISYHTEWFKIETTPYTEPYIKDIVAGNLSTGSAELRVTDGEVYLHITVNEEISIPDLSDQTNIIGIDIGENVLFASSVINTQANTIADVHIESGREFRHHRESLKQKQAQLQSQGKLRKLKQNKHEYEKYTEHILNTASRKIIDLATEYQDSGIVIEDLTHYRTTASNPIHDWPYAEFQNKIIYKAEEEQIPVEIVDPHNTSTICRKCGDSEATQRDGSEFTCQNCGYQVHADVNAALNIALRQSELDRSDIQ